MRKVRGMMEEQKQLYTKMTTLFEKANKKFLLEQVKLLESNVSERTLCGQLMLYLNDVKRESEFKLYYVDVEYNRNFNRQIKTIFDDRENIVRINCDVILHSRGENTEQDNLIAIEMKKSERPTEEKQKDRIRLMALTKDTFNKHIYSYDGITLPEHVCRYILGVYYEINISTNLINIEYYYKGKVVKQYSSYF
ncbi:hypothetical protein [Lysinibacillus capsici]|uniref:hypothetical protein n=1 Tax=Lysinibacillus capsici TaxID=2115968 RepID=UPI002A7FC6BF|nr:hypothetical protein [Lysinibacillus capsici]